MLRLSRNPGGAYPPKSLVKRYGADSPLAEIYDVWFEARRRVNRCYRWRNRKSGNGVHGFGPIKMEFRKIAFDRIMDIQRRSGIILITEEDQAYIRQCWENKVYPRGWSEADESNAVPDDSPGDLITIGAARDALPKPWTFDERIPELTEQIRYYVEMYKPKYTRLLPNCLQPELIQDRVQKLQAMADAINPDVVFVQNKPPKAPKNCYLGYVHPVMAPSGMIFPCDSVVIAAADIGYKEGKPNHTFDNKWAICHWSEIGKIYEQPVRSLVDSQKMCAGCLFWKQNEILESVVDGTGDITPPAIEPEHSAFV